MTDPVHEPPRPAGQVPHPRTGLAAGCLLTGGLLLLGEAGVLPWSIASTAAVLAGGLVAGLLTKGSGWDGALAGAPAGVLLAAGTALHSLMESRSGAGDWTGIMAGIMSSAVIPAVFFIPSTSLGGAIGSVVRSTAEWLTFPAGVRGEAAKRAALWLWTGIVAGAFIIPLSTFAAGSLSFLLLLPPFVGGIIAGLSAAGGVRRGAGSGFLAGILGIGILAIPIVWMVSRTTGFVAGLGWIVLLVMTLFSLPAATAGGILGGFLTGGLLTGTSRIFPGDRRPGP